MVFLNVIGEILIFLQNMVPFRSLKSKKRLAWKKLKRENPEMYRITRERMERARKERAERRAEAYARREEKKKEEASAENPQRTPASDNSAGPESSAGHGVEK